MRKGDAAILATGAVLLAAAAGFRYRPTPDQLGNTLWYARLDKPSFRPSGPAIGAAWTVLDGLMGYAGTRLIAAPASRARATALTGWGVAVSGLFLYPWLMFGRHRLGGAMVAVVAMLGGTVTAVGAGASVDRRAAGALTPLVAWLVFAGVLQEELWRRNR